MVAVEEPDAPMLQLVGPVYAVLPPAHVNEMAATDALPEPVLVRVRYDPADVVAQVNVLVEPPDRKLVAMSAVPVTATRAEFWPWAKMPKTKPPIATEAIRVTAMISTVAMIGEMALRLPSLRLETGDMAHASNSRQSLSGFRHYWQKNNLQSTPQDQYAACVFGSKKRKVGRPIFTEFARSRLATATSP